MSFPGNDILVAAVEGSHADIRAGADTDCPIIASVYEGQPLVTWLSGRRERIDAVLNRHGAVLLRGFDVGEGGMEALLRAYGSSPLPVEEETSPRTHLGGHVFTSTEYPPDQEIVPHNECSYRQAVPSRLFFLCERPSIRGGQTTLVDGDTVASHIDPGILDGFRRKGWTYLRRYGTGLGVDVAGAFGLNDPREIERYCRDHDIHAEWKSDGRLVTRQRRDAFIGHPALGHTFWFNHVCFFHYTSVPPTLRAIATSDDELPYDTRYGDGSAIEERTIDHLRNGYQAGLKEVNWRAGDFLIIDNLRMAHGRRPFEGRRRVLFAMSDLIHRPRFEPLET